MKHFLIALITAGIVVVNAVPQLITLRDGKIGVNFAGYHAEAGLGGLLTGNGAHGGLSASAGTPHGQYAGAGLGGSVDGRTAGGLYAGASGGYGVGASAALGGRVDEHGAYGGEGAEAHAGGVSKKTVKLGANGVVKQISSVQYPGNNVAVASGTGLTSGVVDTRFAEEENEVPVYTKTKTKVVAVAPPPPPPPPPRPKQKVTIVEKTVQPTYTETVVQDRDPFDYRNFQDFGFFSNIAAQYGGPHYPGGHQVIVEKTLYPPQPQVYVSKRVGVDTGAAAGASAGAAADGYRGGISGGFAAGGGYAGGPTLFDSIFNIPISTLTAVNQLLNGHAGGGIAKTKTVAYAT